MARPTSYPVELRQRAVRMVSEVKADFPSEFAAIDAVAKKLGIRSAETLRKWIRRAEVDAGQRPGLTTAEHEQIKVLKKENAELRRANEILKSASAFSRRSSTAHPGTGEVHRRISRRLRGRADLRGAHRERLPDRPVDLLRRPDSDTVESGLPRRRADRGDRG
jgi:transposase